MIKTLLISLKLSHAYNFNTFVYRLRKLPLVGRLFPESLYAKKLHFFFDHCRGNFMAVCRQVFISRNYGLLADFPDAAAAL